MQGTQIWSLIREDPACLGAPLPMCHNHWAFALEPGSCNSWSLHIREPVLHNKRSQCNEKPTHCNWRAAPLLLQTEKSPSSNEDPAQPRTNQWIKSYFKKTKVLAGLIFSEGGGRKPAPCLFKVLVVAGVPWLTLLHSKPCLHVPLSYSILCASNLPLFLSHKETCGWT